MPTTTETITTAQIEQLQTEAAEAGDLLQVELCERAKAGDEKAKAACAKAIRNAEAMQ